MFQVWLEKFIFLRSEVNEGDPICELDGPGSVAEAPKESVPAEPLVAEASGVPQLVSVPDTGSADGVTVIEIAVAVGESVAEGDTLIVLESDKATMEIPAPAPGVVTALKLSEGQQVVQGDPICEMTADNSVGGSAATTQVPSEPVVQAPAEKPISQESGGVEQVVVPDTGNADGVTR